MSYKKIAEQLVSKYDYYADVYYEFVLEAVKNTATDMGEHFAEATLSEIHDHITENYI